MHQYLLLRSTQTESAYGPYTAEILLSEGLNGFRTVDVDTASWPALERGDLAVLTRCFLRTAEIEVLHEAASAGARLVFLQPSARLLARFGWRARNEVVRPGRVRPGEGYRGAGLPLQAHVPISLCEPADTTLEYELLVEALHDDGHSTGYPAVVRQRVGAGEVVFLFYDLPKAVARIRFGDPELASYPTLGVWNWCHAPGLFSGFLDRSLKHHPQADLHGQLLAQVLTRISTEPLARFWYYEEIEHRTAAVFSSDDDWSTPEQFRQLSDALLRHGGRGTFYLVKNTHLPEEQVAEFRRLGHTFAPHIDATSEDDTYFGFPRDLEEETALFRARFGGPSVSLQAHCAPWYGYIDPVPHFAKHGYRLLMHYLSAPAGLLSHFLCGSGRPARFVDLDGTIYDCWQQPCLTYDDSSLQQRITDDFSALIAEFERLLRGCLEDHHSTLCLASHPVSFATYSQPFVEACFELLARNGVRIYSGDEWYQLVARRHAAKLTQEVRADGTLLCTISGLTGRLPLLVPWRGDAQVTVNGTPTEAVHHRRLGEDYLCLQLDGDGTPIAVEVETPR
jgi:hypothetical protein